MKVLIVGGTSGLGLELAQLHVAQGHEVTVVGRSNIDEPNIRFVYFDLTNDHYGMMEIVNREVDRLIWAAGAASFGRADDIEYDELHSVVTVNVTSMFEAVSYILSEQGVLPSLVGITSTSAHNVKGEEPVYSAAKAAQSRLLRCLADDKRIGQVVEIAPAGMNTPFWRDFPEKDISGFLDPKWVAEQSMEKIDSGDTGGWKMLRDPLRVQSIW